jgi:endonuclease-3
MTKTRANEILNILKNNLPMPQWASSARNPFQTLVVTIISQNTAGKNTAKAFERLSNKFKITPEALSKADEKEIEDALRVAGLFRNKAKTIKQVSQIILEKFHGSLDFVHSMPFEEARKTLLTLPGVGPKTADVVLLFSAGKSTIPVDTHVNRVSKRLGLTPAKADYEGVRAALQSFFAPEDFLAVHLLLIMLGRRYCKALKPLCKQCPVNSLCPSKKTEDYSHV